MWALSGWLGTNNGVLPGGKPPRSIAAHQHVERHDRLADAIAVALAETTKAPNMPSAKIQAIALAWIFQTDETGRRIIDGHPCRSPTNARSSRPSSTS